MPLTTLETETQDTTETPLEILFGILVGRVGWETRVGNPRDLRVLLEVLCDGKCVGHVPVHAERESLKTLEEEEGAEWVEAGSEVTEQHDAHVDGVCDCAKCVPELESVAESARS